MSEKKIWDNERNQQTINPADFIKTSSMSELIIWNVNKALEKNPNLELKSALKKAQASLETEQVNVSTIVSQQPDERHLSCALLAWQQLGHSHADSLYNFVAAQMKVELKAQTSKPGTQCTFGTSKRTPGEKSSITHKESDFVLSLDSSSVVTPTIMGPVLKLPATPKNIIPVYNVQGCCGGGHGGGAGARSGGAGARSGGEGGGGGCKGLRKTGQDIKDRIEKACCLESSCVERLAALDKTTKELRQRLGKLAKREADRIELLERAETAWRDLEMGYMRRHRACAEKEEDIIRQSTKLIEDRNKSKDVCSKLVQVLKPRGETAEQARTALKKLETDVCKCTCEQLKMSEQLNKESAILAELQCKCNQQDRDLLFREELARRKKLTIESEIESTRGLMYEAERALRAELKGFKDQLKGISKELLDEDELIEKTKKERDELLIEKKELTEDLEGCQLKCDKYMQNRVDELKEKRDKLLNLKEQELECKCKFPMDTGVQVKRTPSLAALCYCSPEDRAVKSCSCTSMRSRLLSDLFSSLFEGLQAEMGDTTINMPCQLLKCLEDKHNWDKASITKTNLRSYFAKLLCGELEIAIKNSIENYHAKWVGASCADIARPIPDLGGPEIEGWEDRALAQKAHWIAEAMAEKMFNERVDEIMEQAKKLVSAGPPPCTCKPPPMDKNAAVYQCLFEPVMFSKIPGTQPSKHHSSNCTTIATNAQAPEINTTTLGTEKAPAIVSVSTNTKKKRTMIAKSPSENQKESPSFTRPGWYCNKSDVILLRAQIEELKKESLKKHDLKLIEQTIKKLVQRASGPDTPPEKLDTDKEINPSIVNGNPTKNSVTVNKTIIPPRFMKTNSNSSNIKPRKKKSILENIVEIPRVKRQYAVNMCFCGSHKTMTKAEKRKMGEVADESSTSPKNETSKDIISQMTGRQSKPIETLLSQENKSSETKTYLDIDIPEKKMTCGSNCACFNKIPSCSSIDKFLDTLTKWKYDINGLPGVSDADGIFVDTKTALRKTAEHNSSKVNGTSAIVCHSTVTKCSPQKFCELNKLEKMSKIGNDYIPDKNCQLPAAVSEYMGAVNLEKSIDNFCKCVVGAEEKEKYDIHNTVESKKDIQGKYADFNNQRKVKSEEYYQKKEESGNQRKIKSQETYDKNKIQDKDENICVQSKRHINEVSTNSKSIVKDKTQQEISRPCPVLLIDNNYNQLKEPDSKIFNSSQQEPLHFFGSNNSVTVRDLNASNDFTCGCEYQIKLLGVTLANTRPDKKLENKFKEQNSDRYRYLSHTIHEKSQERNNNSSLHCFPLKSMEHYDLFKHDKTNTDISGIQQSLCGCDGKFDEIKDLLDNVYKDKGDAIENKAYDSNSLKDGVKDENCICCPNSLEESNELEVNMFFLLKEHLKKRLEILKGTCQSSYSIKPDEEDMLVSRIFKKVKQTITESTGKILCKCSEEASNDSSWQRAYNLLQEYLKIKISRVQCTCSSPDRNKELTILPELTDKVCLLIEKDFERLKDICKYKSDVKSVSKILSSEEMKFEIPVKDIDLNKSNKSDISDINSLKKSLIVKELSTSYIIATSNISAQVIPNFETKSCEAIKASDPDIKSTVQTQSSNNECSRPKKTCSIHCNLLNAEKNINCPSSQYITGSEQELKLAPLERQVVDQTEDVLSKFKELEVELKQKKYPTEILNPKPLPYIGYTIDCTCTPNLGTCICSRSKVLKNNDAIDKLWSTYTTIKINNQNTSYIMENINKNKKDATDIASGHSCEKGMVKIASKHAITAGMNTNTLEAEEVITLKDSWEYFNKQTRHGGTNTVNGDVYSSGSNMSNYGNWYEPLTNETLEPARKKTVHFLHRSKSVVITTESSKTSVATIHPECECSKVPVCHVKMLVENIENKLANSECTCDSLSSKVCPVHSKKDVNDVMV